MTICLNRQRVSRVYIGENKGKLIAHRPVQETGMSFVRFFVFTLFVVSLLSALTSCPAPKPDDNTGSKVINSNQTTGTPTDATTQADSATTGSKTESGEAAEDTATGDSETAATDESATGETTTGESGEQAKSTDTDSTATGSEGDKGDSAEGTTETDTEKLNPFPPNGGMWTYDDLGKNQNEKVLVLCETDKGNILFEIYPEIAPNSAKAFLDLVKAGYYNETYFHRIIKDFVAQAGSPLNSIELKQYTYNKDNWPVKVKDKVASEKNIGVIKDETNYANNDPGTIALAKVGRAKDTYDKDSAGAEFFINLKVNADLDKYFTVFGKVVSGMDVVTKLTQDDIIRSMREMH
jgi:cyclophilin family peptidyl-prolyl cis-trans isomerase